MDQSRPYQVFSTRIRGVTEKPRVQVDCRNWVTEFKSCSDTMTRIDIDSEYCESVNYRGRPIGEYGMFRHLVVIRPQPTNNLKTFR